MKKQWRRSGKVHSRATHDLADGQVVGVDEKFQVGGEELRFPRDLNASAQHGQLRLRVAAADGELACETPLPAAVRAPRAGGVAGEAWLGGGTSGG